MTKIGAVDFVEDGARWRIGTRACDGFMPFTENRAWFNVGGIRAFPEGRAPWTRSAALGGRWGLVDDIGRVLIEPRYDGAHSFEDGRAWANLGGAMHATHGWDTYSCRGGLWALVDRDGRERVSPTFTSVGAFTGGVAWARLGQWGLVDLDGAWLISPRFDDTPWRSRTSPAFVDGVEPVAIGTRWGLIDRTGEWRVPPRFDHVYDLREGVARVAMWLDDPEEWEQTARSGLFGFVAASGRVLHEPAFSDATDFRDGRAKVTLNGRSAEIDRDGALHF